MNLSKWYKIPVAKFGAVDLSRHANLQRVFHIDTGINVKELPDYLQEKVSNWDNR